eukprot:snap_masked-scaffold_2-processed-gene-13.0-mRNA-1 protein AED:1.00 eAED:1.00 QI:0/-1/0/0/-1/1/1/0/658
MRAHYPAINKHKIEKMSFRNISSAVNFYIFTHAGSLESAENYLNLHSEGLFNLLYNSNGMKGVLVIYISPAAVWRRMIKYVSNSHSGVYGYSFTPEKIKKRTEKMQIEFQFLQNFENSCAEVLQNFLSKNSKFNKWLGKEGIHRVRLVSPYNFISIFDRIKSRQRDSFQYWFEQATYDVPKLADAFIRLRNIGGHIPVMRYDIDVIFSQDSLEDKMQKLSRSTVRLVNEFQRLNVNSITQSFCFSGQYFFNPLLEGKENREKYKFWGEAFSTRSAPALKLTDALCADEQFDNNKTFEPKIEDLDQATNDEVMQKFFGVSFDERRQKILNGELQLNLDEDLVNLGHGIVGANPLSACVSGAGFCVSVGISLDLPPFSNFRSNVLWVDDELLVRFAQRLKLTRHNISLGEINSGHTWTLGEAKNNPVKARGIPKNILWYTLEVYIPTFIFGCILDSWITAGPLHYLPKFANIPGKETTAVDGPLITAVKSILTRGRMLEKDVIVNLKNDLRAAALERIKLIYYQWSRPEFKGTIMYEFATGSITSHPRLRKFCLLDEEKKAGVRYIDKGRFLVKTSYHERVNKLVLEGALKGKKLSINDLPKLTGSDLNPTLEQLAMYDLIDDAVSYLEWILVWPSVVQAVRVDPDGHSVMDPIYLRQVK